MERPIKRAVKKEIQDQLDAVLAAHEQAALEAASAKASRDSAEAEFLKEFLAHRSSVFRPALQEMATYLRSKGIESTISETEHESTWHDGEKANASIALRLGLGDDRLSDLSPDDEADEQPYLALVCNVVGKVVLFLESTKAPGRDGHAGPIGSYYLHQVTTDFIQEKVLAIVSEVFRG